MTEVLEIRWLYAHVFWHIYGNKTKERVGWWVVKISDGICVSIGVAKLGEVVAAQRGQS